MRPAPELGELQRWFLERVTSLEPDAPGREPAASAVILPSRALSPEERIDIYARMYFLRLRRVLAQEYRTVVRLVGEDEFTDLARDYLRRHPSRSYTLNDLGHVFPRYLRESCRRDDAGLLVDVARLERAIAVAFDTYPLGVLSADALARIPAEAWADVRFRMEPSVQVMEFEHDACGIVDAHADDEPLPDLAPRPSWAVVWRHDHLVWRRPLSREQYTVLGALASGATIGAALERAADVWDGDEAALETRIFQWFSDWLSEGYFSAVVQPAAR